MQFYKYQGTGNDFIIVDYDWLPDSPVQQVAKRICDRNFGIGADGLLVVSRPCSVSEAKWQMSIYNADGSEAEMCGNGLRCVVRFLIDQGYLSSSPVIINTKAGLRQASFYMNESQQWIVSVNMGTASFLTQPIKQKIELDEHLFWGHMVSMGNPHCVVFVEDISQIEWEQVAMQMQGLSLFPEQVNVEFVEIISEHRAKVVVYERGVGPTLACGTGACAVVAAGIQSHRFKHTVVIQLPGGELTVSYKREGMFLEGPASKVFTGDIDI